MGEKDWVVNLISLKINYGHTKLQYHSTIGG